jgi:hypothetical protein
MFVGGIVYVIEEEVYSDSDDSSVYTSEDDFEEDRNMISTYVEERAIYDAKVFELAEIKRKDLMNPAISANQQRLIDIGAMDDPTLTED